MDEHEKINELKLLLDRAETERFELKQDLDREQLVRYELEELVRNIYHECKAVLKNDEKPELEQVLENLAENIRKMTRSYRINL